MNAATALLERCFNGTGYTRVGANSAILNQQIEIIADLLSENPS